jgi:hypothetical protein
MKVEKETPDEWEAKWLVAAHLGGVPRRLPPPGPDYDIRLPDGRTIALEVTTSAPADRKALWRAIDGSKAGVPHIETTWQLTIIDRAPRSKSPRVDRIYAAAPELLRMLEVNRVEGFGRGWENVSRNAPEAAHLAIGELLALKIDAGHSLGPGLQIRPQLLIGTVGEGRGVDPEAVNEAAEACAQAKAAQLQRADADEHHLFVVVGVDDYAAFPPLTVGHRLPDRSPQLPREVTTVWVGAWQQGLMWGTDLSPVWKAPPPSAWVRLSPEDARGWAARHGEERP